MDMVEACRSIERTVDSNDSWSLLSDEDLRDATLFRFAIIGEAAARVSPDLRERVPSIPWQATTALRNRVVHGYFSLDWNIVWNTMTISIPALRTDLERILAQFQTRGSSVGNEPE